MARIAIIGGGSMGEAILAGLLRAGRQVKDLVVAERVPERVEYPSSTYSVRVTSVSNAVENAAFVIVAVKPTDTPAIVAEIAQAAAQADNDSVEQVLVTVAAGVTINFFESRLPAGSPVIRAMPNAPALVGGSITALSRGRFATAEQLAEVGSVSKCVGSVITVPEAVGRRDGDVRLQPGLLSVRRVAGGCRGGERLSRATATELAVQTMAGSAEMLLDSMLSEKPVATKPWIRPGSAAGRRYLPRGTTAAGLRELERGGLRAAVTAAVDAAKPALSS